MRSSARTAGRKLPPVCNVCILRDLLHGNPIFAHLAILLSFKISFILQSHACRELFQPAAANTSPPSFLLPRARREVHQLQLKVCRAAGGHGDIRNADDTCGIDGRDAHDLACRAEQAPGEACLASAAGPHPCKALRRDVDDFGELAEKVRAVGVRLVHGGEGEQSEVAGARGGDGGRAAGAEDDRAVGRSGRAIGAACLCVAGEGVRAHGEPLLLAGLPHVVERAKAAKAQMNRAPFEAFVADVPALFGVLGAPARIDAASAAPAALAELAGLRAAAEAALAQVRGTMRTAQPRVDEDVVARMEGLLADAIDAIGK